MKSKYDYIGNIFKKKIVKSKYYITDLKKKIVKSKYSPAKVDDEALGTKFIPTELLVWVQNQRSTPVSLRKTKGTKGMRPPALTRLSREPEPTVQSALTLEYNSIRVDVMFRLTTSSASKWTARRLPRELKKERLKCKQTATK